VLEMRRISKTFAGTKALHGVDLAIYPGEVHALMGENGAGKSTLMKILAGACSADPGGEIWMDGQRIEISSPLAARRHGIAIIYQELSLAPNLSVAENIHLGQEIGRAGILDRATMDRAAEAALRRLGADFGPRTSLATLSVAERQLVEIARAVHARSRILVMDEPTTALSSRETDYLFALIRELRAGGLAIIYISHRMAEVYELADRVTVLRDGTYVGSVQRGQIDPDTIVRMMVGRELSSFYKHEHRARLADTPTLEVRALGDSRRVHDCSFAIRAGEVLGLAGMVGAGRTELARLLFGAAGHKSGDIILEGITRYFHQPREAIAAGVAYLTEDRKIDGLFLDMAVADNIILCTIENDARFGGILDRARGRQRAVAAIRALAIRVASPTVGVGLLSGGNQQKVLLSRLLEAHPKVLILDEPTRGIDIGAKFEIYRIIDQLAGTGVAILLISSELAEIIGISDRVLVMREGRIAGELTGSEMNQENIVALATGSQASPARRAIQ